MNIVSFPQPEEDELISLKEKNEISGLIRKFAIEKFGYKRVYVSSAALSSKMPQASVTIALRKSLIDLYLRFGKYAIAAHKDKKYIVIARMGFKKQKNGYGTALLKELCNFGEKFGYEYLEIECPNPDCQAFMKKLGFKDEFYLPIDQLKKSIQAYELSKQAKVSLL
ncbi:GNAT family N-acetyltransferase [Acinetobacter baumannii]|uniref:GNAT family N-acetyltransferase n=1 Tax=Acinetobacter baumannii TaxID=470 RepID=A0AAP1W670_ACIBA|nr:GNAT family N-acetyltransferase [Acinetobacter baumannii]MBD2849091.1 GNAT family N-acetyltransferase [Acinetobacter baumannii]MBD3132775.1 GNAT family N-acetyltransferase [Acinetobacter baumannii]MBE0306574.1 GNAT family N-acetyltransferase [Acinetobacter baumannii]MBE0311880.1 GNAT family N-acetyltransferase [Acinetobacter baumannii]MBE0329387.1 GNAT family N-acetyltransferase [Acinetobacter baumannii]